MSDEQQQGEGYTLGWVPITDALWGKGFLVPGGAATIDRTVGGLDLAGKRILDFGSGIGGGTIKLARDHAAYAIGVDIEEDFVAYSTTLAKELGAAAEVEFRRIEPGKLPLDDASFDCFHTSGVLCHIDDRRSVLSDAYRVLKPGGVIAGYDWYVEKPNAETSRWEEVAGFRMYPSTQEQRLKLLRELGFVNVAGEDITPVYLPKIAEEIATLEGPYFEQAAKDTSAEERDHFIQEWKCMKAALDTGLVRQGIFRGTKPA
ncbi:MAG: methyltransferase domain-containing protein [Pseudomonadota bacterium]